MPVIAPTASVSGRPWSMHSERHDGQALSVTEGEAQERAERLSDDPHVRPAVVSGRECSDLRSS